MKSLSELRKRAASRSRKKAQVYSTSEARANFAEALETAQVDNAVIGFDRYGRTVAALVPVEAIYMLAGLGHLIPLSTREEIKSGSLMFVRNVPSRVDMEEEAPPPKPAKKAPAKKAQKQKRPGRG